MNTNRLSVKVYLEDTDAQGIVYHANYLKFCERGRTELLHAVGVSLADMQSSGWTFVMHEMHLKYHRPALLEDQLEVETTMERATPYRATFRQKIFRRGEELPLFRARAEVVTIGHDKKLRELPESMFPAD